MMAGLSVTLYLIYGLTCIMIFLLFSKSTMRINRGATFSVAHPVCESKGNFFLILDVAVFENRMPGVLVAVVNATDLDFGEFGTITYTIHSDLLSETFSIDASSGKITTKTMYICELLNAILESNFPLFWQFG